MNISYSTDENYAVHAYISLHSLLENNKDEKEIICYLIDNQLSSDTRANFKSLMDTYQTSENVRVIKFIDFSPYEQIVKNATPCGSLSTYGRIFLPEITDIDRILYIDCDTIICGKLGDLYYEDLTDCAVAGVQDVVALSRRKPVGLKYGDRYINAGVSLLNLDYWRKNNGQQRCLDFIESFGGSVPFEDQGTINGVFKGHIKIVSPKYNMMNPLIDYSASQISAFMDVENYYTDAEVKDAQKDVRLVHFTAGFYLRPWFENSNHPYRNVYLNYRKKSPWKGMPLSSPVKSISRRETLDHMFRLYCPLSVFRIAKHVVKKFRQ